MVIGEGDGANGTETPAVCSTETIILYTEEGVPALGRIDESANRCTRAVSSSSPLHPYGIQSRRQKKIY
jgi:hypothetical protein